MRTKGKAEVFTPTWIVKKQNYLVNAVYQGLTLEEYLKTTWLEITCGEAPYMCSRYDTVTGEPLPLDERVGFVDRKLRRISEEVNDSEEWISMAITAYQSSYGYEFQGDSLFLARENLLQTFIDYYCDKFDSIPEERELKTIATIISYNVFQMDGLKYIIPNLQPETEPVKVVIKDWEKAEFITFESMTTSTK